MTFISLFFVGVFSYGLVVQATPEIRDTCNHNVDKGENPSLQTINCLLTEVALSYDIPPEIVKAIAESESGWQQYNDVGEPLISPDGGIGIMQITNKGKYDQTKLKTDIVYNITAGVEIIDSMFERNDLPTINDGNREIIEDWYFAIMAYNGIKPTNSPIIKATGNRNSGAYQEKVLAIAEKNNLMTISDLPFSVDDFEYDSGSTENIEFTTMHYDFQLPLTRSKHYFNKGQKVGAKTDVNLRKSPTTASASITTLNKGDIVEITGPFQYDTNSKSENHFVWYPIKRNNGTTGFIASSYLDYRFSDVPQDHYAEEKIYYLADRDILNGVGNNKFGMNMDIPRWQVVLLITRANNTSLENRPDPDFSDVSKDYKYYKQIAAAVDEGLFAGTGNNEFKPNKTMTRAEMAVVLQRLYEFPESTSATPFTDLTAEWYRDSVTRLYNAGITEGINEAGTKFGPRNTVTREQFAVFMARAMEPDFRD